MEFLKGEGGSGGGAGAGAEENQKNLISPPMPSYSSVPNKRNCTPYLISTKLPPCTLLFGTASLSIFWIFVKYSGLIWKNFGKN